MASNPNIVIIGGSYAGLGTAHALLAALPTIKVTLINTSKHHYFNLAAPRIIARPDEISLDQVMIPITSLFTKHSPERFEFVQGTVTSMDTAAKCVIVEQNEDSDEEDAEFDLDGKKKKIVSYDYLVIASGSHTQSTLSHPCIPTKHPLSDTLRPQLIQAQLDVAAAQSIVIGGSGPLAVEFAGEIADAYPAKKVTIISGSPRLLPSIKASASNAAAKMLKSLRVEIRYATRVQSSDWDEEKKKWFVGLSSGEVLEVDLYISAMGVLPNNGFVPKTMLDDKGWLKVDDELRVVGEEAIYGVGDIITESWKMTIVIKNQVDAAVTNLAVDINGTGTRKAYKRGISAMIVPVGKVGGTGQIGSFVLWSWMATMIKGDFFISRNTLYVSGK
jgi:NADH dehydrogenase FAD-containing subunit